jgi:hypothetical protein
MSIRNNKEKCPACGEVLNIIDVAPCDDCGGFPKEIEHFKNKEHKYAKFEVYGSILTLCNFCDVDFSSYAPSFWGLKTQQRPGYGSPGFRKISEIPHDKLSIKKGKFCPHCNARLTLINAKIKAQTTNAI